ncbi:hypothetical protein L7F22_015413 [Adiantum nelumboides]|nr:hypothetical protein [Adiantum nelumboides]
MPPRRVTRSNTGNPEIPEVHNNIESSGTPEVVLREDFGRDKDLKALLKSVQPEPFTGEDSDIAGKLDEWIISMEDYFELAEYNSIAKGIMGRAKIKGSAKIWRKLNCKSRGVAQITQSWEELQLRLRERYSPPNYMTTKMNEFLACVRRGLAIDTYYEEFVKLSRYAPLMTEEQKLSRFILGLERKLADEVEALRPASLADALIRAKPKLNSFIRSYSQQGERKREQPYHFESSYRPPKFQNMPRPENPPEIKPVRVNALPITQSGRPIQCFDCQEFGHKRFDCPRSRQNRGFHYQNRGLQRQHRANRNQDGKEEIPIVKEKEEREEEVYYDSSRMLESIEEADVEKTAGFERDNSKVAEQEKFYDFPNQRPRHQKHYRAKRKDQVKEARLRPMPAFKNKTHFLIKVNTIDCVKDKVSEISPRRRQVFEAIDFPKEDDQSSSNEEEEHIGTVIKMGELEPLRFPTIDQSDEDDFFQDNDEDSQEQTNTSEQTPWNLSINLELEDSDVDAQVSNVHHSYLKDLEIDTSVARELLEDERVTEQL